MTDTVMTHERTGLLNLIPLMRNRKLVLVLTILAGILAQLGLLASQSFIRSDPRHAARHDNRCKERGDQKRRQERAHPRDARVMARPANILLQLRLSPCQDRFIINISL